MLRPLIAAGLLLTLASIASSQSATSPDDALSPMEVISALPPAPRPAPAAKPDAAKKTKAGATPEAPKVDRLAQCLRDWDAATHMTRQEWARTCRRVIGDRAQANRDQDGK